MNFPDFNTWHKVPEDADIPAQTPYFTAREGEFREYLIRGWDETYFPEARNPDRDYYTEEPILSPDEEKIEKRARTMYYAMGGTGWEYEGTPIQNCWRNLAKKYVEKED